jgi:hypothetical protein
VSTELAAGNFISAFKWDAGEAENNTKWTQELPTDTQILIHLFCTRMDDILLPADPQHARNSFTTRHYVIWPQNPAKVNSNMIIYQPHLHPPHFNLIVEKETWPILKVRSLHI